MTEALSLPRHQLTLAEWDALPRDETLRQSASVPGSGGP